MAYRQNTKPKLLQGKVPFSCGSADCGMMHRHSRKHAAACAYPLPSGFQTRTVQCVSCRFSNTLQRLAPVHVICHPLCKRNALIPLQAHLP